MGFDVLLLTRSDGSTNAVYTYGFERVSRNISDKGTASAYKTKASTAGTGAVDGGLSEISSYYLYDGRGSVAAMADMAGTITNSYQYDAYGNLTFGTPVNINYYGYNAESSNTNTGLQYLRARYYNPANGNFTSEDTEAGGMTNPLTQNRYDYVTNNPLNYADPTGHKLAAQGMKYDRYVNPKRTPAKSYGKTSSRNQSSAGRQKTPWKPKEPLWMAAANHISRMKNAKGYADSKAAAIKNRAIEKGLIPDVPVKTVTDSMGKTCRYVDFDSAGLVKEKVYLPEELWNETDAVQFKWLDDKIGGRPEGYTWHHSEISGQMELVPTGIHNIYNHNGGRSINHWAYREGGR